MPPQAMTLTQAASTGQADAVPVHDQTRTGQVASSQATKIRATGGSARSRRRFGMTFRVSDL